MIIDNGDGEMVYQNNRHYPINRAHLKRLMKAIENTINFFDSEGLDDCMIEKLELNQKDFYINQQRERYRKERIEKKNKPKDHLYLITNIERSRLKIGRSKNPEARLKQLQISSHEKLLILFVIDFSGDYEKDIHSEFKNLRLNSEWFFYDESIINKFKKLISQNNEV